MENNSIAFSLREIANWTDKCSNIKIPALQRGLVWKPRQVELLWDSLLRGFPIGSFLLSETDNNQYYLLDGQQRFNAISLGFNTVSNAKSVVWIDLKPQKQTERKYWIKVTTEAHPWGFYNDDECSILDVKDRRKAAEAFGFKDKNIYRDDFSLFETWPIEAGLPIPLYIILNIDANTPSEFCEKFLSDLQKSSYIHKAEIDDESLAYLKDHIFYAIQRIRNYKINCNLLTKDVIESEGDIKDNDNDQTALELLFKRLNTGGTTISQEDLAYSSIKAFWPEIQEINDSLAKDYMPPAKLATLTFGLLLSDQNKKFGVTAQEAIDDLARKLQPVEDAINMDRYLFLDFDGVLNTGKYAKQMKREGIDPFDEFGAIFDPEAIANLEHIVELTGCKIILSTTWRNEGIMRMRELWKQRGLPGEIFSMTPILLSTSFQDAMNGEMMGMPLREAKALEINAWLYQNAVKDYRYVILDDENYFFPKQQEHLVVTDEKEGLTDRKAQNVIWILNS